MTNTKKRKPVGCILIVTPFVALLLYFFWTQLWIHDYFLYRISLSYNTIKHPPTTQRIKKYNDIGLLIANGNHIDLFVGEIRSYTGPREGIIKWYSNKTVQSQLDPEEKVPFDVVFIDNNKLSSGKIGFDRPYSLENMIEFTKSQPENLNFYIVYILDATGYDPGIDIRGM